MQAVERGDAEIVQMLLDKGAKPNKSVGNRTPLSVAKRKGDPKMIALLEWHVPSWYLCTT
jgi:ankyrin repeat protein